ncbi:hypothetical protein AAAC51_35095 [Priestia megaterium]
MPLLGLEGDPDANKAVDSKTNINIVANMLGKDLEAQGIGAEVDQTNIGQKLKKRLEHQPIVRHVSHSN